MWVPGLEVQESPSNRESSKVLLRATPLRLSWAHMWVLMSRKVCWASSIITNIQPSEHVLYVTVIPVTIYSSKTNYISKAFVFIQYLARPGQSTLCIKTSITLQSEITNRLTFHDFKTICLEILHELLEIYNLSQKSRPQLVVSLLYLLSQDPG